MHVSMKENVTFKTKSFTSIYDLYRSKNVADKTAYKQDKGTNAVKETPGGDCSVKVRNDSSESNNNFMAFVTCEKYHNLNQDISNESIIRSSSTLFYDLDNIAFRHSLADISVVSYTNCLSNFNISSISPNGFRGKSHAIVQECATQIKPKLHIRDSIEINTKKITKCFPNDPDFSSEIFLRDNDITDFVKDQQSNKHLKRNQKYWSYAKYRTEYTNPNHQDKKAKKKERTRHIEDPCPCQLFSYTCPCTENKSLTGLKNSKSLTDQVTSTSNIMKEDRKEVKNSKPHKGKKNKPKDDKPTSITCFDKLGSCEKSDEPLDYSDKYKMESFETSDQPLVYSEKYGLSQSIENTEDTNNKCKSSSKKKRKIWCPNCKEKIEISSLIDPSEGEGSLKNDDSLYQIKEHGGKSIYTYKTCVKKQSLKVEEKEQCHHNPRCELVPLCQILPTDNVFLNYKLLRKSEISKNSPRVIRITKACRHHPPCTVAPSCQRANILKNNCEFIPPCLHRPRCVNLPLCVPFSKNIHYDELAKHLDDPENDECPHTPRCKYIPECQQDYNANLSNQIQIAQLQNTCGILSEIQPSYIKPPFLQKTFSPCQISPAGYLGNFESPRTDKSCQYDSLDCPINRNIHESVSSEAVVFIRDVGCQFRNKYNTPRDSLRSTKSSILFDYDSLKLGSIYRNVHTLRYEDKFTNPKGKIEIDTSSLSLTSNFMVSSFQRKYGDNEPRPSGFDPKPVTSPFVAYTTALKISSHKRHAKKLNSQNNIDNYNAYAVKSRVSITKNKYRKVFNIKRKRKKRGDSQLFFYRKTV